MRFCLLAGIACFGTFVYIGCSGTAPSSSSVSSDPDTTTSSRPARTTVQEPPSTLGPRNEKSVSVLREAYENGRYDTVVRRAQERLRERMSGDDAIHLHMLLGQAEQERGRHERAIDAVKAARKIASEKGQSTVRMDRTLGESYAALYRWSLASSAFRRLLAVRPNDRHAQRALADAYWGARDWENAKQHYAQLVERDSARGQWWARLAQCEVKLGEIERAIRHFARAHQLLPHHADVTLTLSRFYRSTMQPHAARRVIDTTLSYRPGDSRLWRRRADLAFERDNFERARPAYERAISTGDSSATPYRRIGLIHVKRREYERALSALRHSFRLDSTHSRTTLYLGISYLRIDSLKKASTYLRKTIAQEAHGPVTKAFVQRGLLNDRRGDVAASVRAYKTALRLRPQRSDVYFHLASLYDEHYEEKKTAAVYYRRFLRESDSTRFRLRTYAQDRLAALRSTLHMQEARPPRDSVSKQ